MLKWEVTSYKSNRLTEQEVKVIWQKAPHGLGVTPGGRNCTIEFLG